MRKWTLCYDSNFDDHPPIVISGPAITPEEQEVEVVEKAAYDELETQFRIADSYARAYEKRERERK